MPKIKAVLLTIAFLIISLLPVSFAQDTKIYFSPNGGCVNAIVGEIEKAQDTVDVAMYYLTSREIAQALVKAKSRKLAVRVFLDKSQEYSKYAKSRFLKNGGIEVRYYTGNGLMHNKFAVIDGKVLITGSFNWTPTADTKNQENLMIITDAALVAKYIERFESLWQKGRKAS